MPARRAPVARPEPEQAVAEIAALLAGAGRTLWAWRLELAGVALVAGVFLALSSLAAPIPAALLTIGLVAAAVALTRAAVLAALHRARIRRAWAHAWNAATGSHGTPGAVPRVRSARRVPAGDLLTVRVRRGQSVPMIEQRAAQLAAELRAMAVEVRQNAADASIATVLIRRNDPLDAPTDTSTREGKRFSGVLSPSGSLWRPIPLGVDEHGQAVTVTLPERNLLVGGLPGAGKSNALSLVIAAAALDPRAGVWLIDVGKSGAELGCWQPIARSVATNTDQARDVLIDVAARMENRYRTLLGRGIRKVPEGTPLQLLVVDEAATLLATGDRDRDREFAALLRDVVQRGRAAGIVVVLATQRPSADLVPSSLRDLFGFRLSLRSSTPEMSDTILGRGYASAGYDASSIPNRQRGVGFLLDDEAEPRRIRLHHLDDDELQATVEAAIDVRIKTDALTTVTGRATMPES